MTTVTQFKVGDPVTVRFRSLMIAGVLTAVDTIRRGRFAGRVKYTVAPTDPKAKAKWISVTVTDPSLLTPRTASKAEVKATADEYWSRRSAKQQRRIERVEAGREKLGNVNWQASRTAGTVVTNEVGPGDRVLIKGSGGSNWWATVGKVNIAGGSVGIVRSDGGSLDPNVRQLDGFLWRMGIGRQRRPREFRYIPGRFILEVKSQEKALPFALKPEHRAAIEKDGYVQVRFGREFIEKSYVVASSRKLARKGHDYEVASHIVYADPELAVFWRATGSFD